MITYDAWLNRLKAFFEAETYNTSFGTTSFFSNINDAQIFVENNFLENPRLSEIEKTILLENSKNSRALAIQQSNIPAGQALLYWQFMRDYILLNTYDEKLADLFDLGVQYARDTKNLTFDEDVETPIEFPIWFFIFPLLFLFGRRR